MRAFTKKQAPAPWPWDMVRYCLELPHGAIRHFPAGTYNEQVQTATGRLELEMMSITHSAWYAFKHLSMAKWGDNEARLAKWMMPAEPKPVPPTRLLDYVINRLWRGSEWFQLVMSDLRKDNDDG